MLRNHGLLTCGRSIGEAYWLMQRLETACKMQVAALAGGPPHWPSIAAQQRTSAIFDRTTGSEHVSRSGALEWEAMLRQLDRIDRSYRD